MLLCAALLLWNLGYATFWNPDEARYASSSLEMARGFEGHAPDWIVPHFNTVARLNKPPLVYWLAASFYRIFGAHEWSGRLGSAFFAIGVMLLLWQMARRVWSERVGIFAAIIWTTSLFPFIMARTLNTDMLLCGAFTLAMFGLWRGLEYSMSQESGARSDWSAFAIAALGLGLAILAKGPVGAVLPLLISFFYLLAARRWSVLRNAKIWTGVFLALAFSVAVVAPWTLAVQARYPDFLKSFLLGENLHRFAGGKDFHNATPFYYYVPVVLLGFLPWTPLLFVAAFFRPRDTSSLQNRTQIFLWMWAVVVVVLFSASSTKLVSYVLPAFPALAVLCAVALDRVLETARWRRAFASMIMAMNALFLALAVYATWSETLVTRAAGAPYLAAMVVVLSVGSLCVWRLRNSENAARSVYVQAATTGAFFVVLLFFAGVAARFNDSSSLVARLTPHLLPREKLTQMTFQPTSVFYTERPTTIIGFDNESGLHKGEVARSPLFLVPELVTDTTQNDAQKMLEAKTMAELLNAPARAFILIKRRDYAQTRLNAKPFLKIPTFIIGRANDFLILSNRRAPIGFAFENVAPKFRDRETKLPAQRVAP